MTTHKFIFEKQKIKDVQVIIPFRVTDERGEFRKTFEKNIFKENDINMEVAEVMTSISKKGVIRGLHMQYVDPQAKLITVEQGEIFDVAVDIRKNSLTYGQYVGVYLSEESSKMFYIPKGFLHGFIALKDNTVVNYLCSMPYLAQYDGGVIWNDPDINIQWPLDRVEDIYISDKDKHLPTLKNYMQYWQ